MRREARSNRGRDLNTRRLQGSHGVYALIGRLSRGILDGRSRPAAAVRELRDAILEDLPGPPTAKQEALALEAARKGVILSVLYSHALKEPVQDGKLHPLLGEHALAWSNSMRLDLAALGGGDGTGERVDEEDVAARIVKLRQREAAQRRETGEPRNSDENERE